MTLSNMSKNWVSGTFRQNVSTCGRGVDVCHSLFQCIGEWWMTFNRSDDSRFRFFAFTDFPSSPLPVSHMVTLQIRQYVDWSRVFCTAIVLMLVSHNSPSVDMTLSIGKKRKALFWNHYFTLWCTHLVTVQACLVLRWSRCKADNALLEWMDGFMSGLVRFLNSIASINDFFT